MRNNAITLFTIVLVVKIRNRCYNYRIVFCVDKTACQCTRRRTIRTRSDGAAEWSAIGRESKKEENAEKKEDVGIW